MHVYKPAGYTPRHLRRNKDHGAVKDTGKRAAFQRAAAWSKRFIHQKASQLEKPGPLHDAYMDWSGAANRGALRRSTGKKE